MIRTSIASVLDPGPFAVGDHVGHRDRRTWRIHAPGRIAAIDPGVSPTTYRISPTVGHLAAHWTAPAADLTRLGTAGPGLSYALGAGARSGGPIDVLAPNGSAHTITIRAGMVIDTYRDQLGWTRCRVLTDDGDIWDVAGEDLVYVAPWR